MSQPSIRVRMYHVGFGDCFLLRFPDRTRDRLVLIDCGSHTASQDEHPLKTVVGDIIETAKAVTGEARIDVVVATHRHLDHVQGFRDPRWVDVEVGEVWLPWTEDPDDPQARSIRDRQSQRVRTLRKLAVDADTSARWEAVRAIARNNDELRNALAMAMLHGGFAGTPRRSFLPERPGGTRERTIVSPHLPGVTVEVVGPLRSEAAIRDLDPPADEQYVRLGTKSAVVKEARDLPYDKWLIGEKAYRASYDHLTIKAGDLGTIVNIGQEDALGLAVALEDAVNGTSLMLLFRYGGLALLFAGDAEWGTWDAALGQPVLAESLKAVDLYKVSHHGSVNGTPPRFVEHQRDPGVALVSVGPTSIPTWQGIPRKPLLEALDRHHLHVIRSDRWRETAAGGQQRAAAKVRAEVTVADDGLWTEVALTPRDAPEEDDRVF